MRAKIKTNRMTIKGLHIVRWMVVPILLWGAYFEAEAQLNNGLNFNPHFSSVSSNTFPSKIGEGFNKVEVVFPHMRGWLGNNAINYDQVSTLLSSGTLSGTFIDDVINGLKEENRVGIGAELQLLKVNVNIKNKEKKNLFSFSLGATEKVGANLKFNKELFSLIYEGNSQFAGENVDLGPAGFNALYYRDIALGVGVPIRIPSEKYKITIKPAARFSYLIGIASMYTKEGDISMFTEADGRYIDFDFNYDLNTGIPDQTNDFIGGIGNGFAVDAGVSISINDVISALIALDNLGGIRFDKNVENYQRKGKYTYDGLEIDVIETETNEPAELDSLLAIFDPEINNEAYKMPLDKSLAFQAELKLGKALTRKKEIPYHKHHVYLAYLQGFENYLTTSTSPQVSVGYTYSLANVLNVGSSLSLGGYNKIAFGPHLSVKAGFFKFGIGSGNITPFIARRAGSGVDLDVSMALSF